MNKTFRLAAAAAATLLATAAQAAVLTLAPATLAAHPGDTSGWGFTLLNDDASNWLIVTGSEFTLAPPSAFGSYTDLLGQTWTVLAPQASLTQAYDAGLGTGIGQFSLAPTAQARLDGQVQLHYMLTSVDPGSAGFDPDVNLVSLDSTAVATAAVQAVPEPATWAMFGAAGLLALVRRRLLKPSQSA